MADGSFNWDLNWDLDAIANHCRMTTEQARAAIIVLRKAGLIESSSPRSGQALEFHLTKTSSWRSPEDLIRIRGHAPNADIQYPGRILASISSLSGAEFKVVSVICRETRGVPGQTVKLTNPFLMAATDLSDQGVRNAVFGLLAKGLISQEKHRDGTEYGIISAALRTSINAIASTN
jgi:hypothetical protein